MSTHVLAQMQAEMQNLEGAVSNVDYDDTLEKNAKRTFLVTLSHIL